MYWSIHWSLWINKWSTVYPAVVWYWVVINGSNKLWFYLVIDPMKRFWYLRPWLKSHLKFSMIGQVVKMTFKYRCLLNRGDHMDRFDCNIIVIPSRTKLRRDIVTLPSVFLPSFRNILVNTPESTSFNGFWPNLVNT